MTDFTEVTDKISLGDGLNSYEIYLSQKLTSINNESKYYIHMEVKENNLNFVDLLNELKKAGIKMKTYETEKMYFVLLIYGRENLNR